MNNELPQPVIELNKGRITVTMPNGDGEWWRIIVQRKSDKKFFEYNWGYDHAGGNYMYEPNLYEVSQVVETKTIEVITYK